MPFVGYIKLCPKLVYSKYYVRFFFYFSFRYQNCTFCKVRRVDECVVLVTTADDARRCWPMPKDSGVNSVSCRHLASCSPGNSTTVEAAPCTVQLAAH